MVTCHDIHTGLIDAMLLCPAPYVHRIAAFAAEFHSADNIPFMPLLAHLAERFQYVIHAFTSYYD